MRNRIASQIVGLCRGGDKSVCQAAHADAHFANLQHALLQQQIADIRAHHHQQDHRQRLDSQPVLVTHFCRLIVAAGRLCSRHRYHGLWRVSALANPLQPLCAEL